MALRATDVDVTGRSCHLQFCLVELLPEGVESFWAQITVGALKNVPRHFAINVHPLWQFPDLNGPICKLVIPLVDIIFVSQQDHQASLSLGAFAFIICHKASPVIADKRAYQLYAPAELIMWGAIALAEKR